MHVFNLNDSVWVQLTDYGRTYARAKRQEVAEDPEGWSEWTMWKFMQVFGDRMIMGSPEVCDMNVRLSKPEPKPTGIDELDEVLKRISELESRVRLTQHRLAAAAQMCADIDRDPRVHPAIQGAMSMLRTAMESEPQEDDGHV